MLLMMMVVVLLLRLLTTTTTTRKMKWRWGPNRPEQQVNRSQVDESRRRYRSCPITPTERS